MISILMAWHMLEHFLGTLAWGLSLPESFAARQQLQIQGPWAYWLEAPLEVPVSHEFQSSSLESLQEARRPSGAARERRCARRGAEPTQNSPARDIGGLFDRRLGV